MTLDQIQYFCAAAQFGSFSKAAQSVHISQPSLCIAIRKLESEFGVALFQTNRKGAVLTAAGRIFLPDAQNILAQTDLALTHIRQYAQRDRAEIRIAYTASMSDGYIPKLLKGFLAEEGKGCTIYSDEMPTEQITQGLRDGHFDFGLTAKIPPDPELEQTPLFYQKLCLLIPPEEQNPSRYENLAELSKTPMICYRKDYPVYRQIAEIFQDKQIEPNIIHYAYSEGAIANLVEQGLGIGIVAEIPGIEKYNVQHLVPAWLTGGRYIYLTTHRTKMSTYAAKLLQKRILADRKLDEDTSHVGL